MSRIHLMDPAAATGRSKELLDTVQKKIGMTPNLMRGLANAPAALDAYLSLSDAISHGGLTGKLREQLALAIGQANQCDYCLAAHTAIGGSLGLGREEMFDNRRGTSSDSKTEAALRFAQEVVEKRGRVSDESLAAVRAAGFSDGDIAEIVAVVTLNLFTNYFNHIADTPIDFPEAHPLDEAV